MALPTITGSSTYFSINQDAYPLNVARVIRHGNAIGLAIGDTVISNPIPDYLWGYASIEDAIDGFGEIIYN